MRRLRGSLSRVARRLPAPAKRALFRTRDRIRGIERPDALRGERTLTLHLAAPPTGGPAPGDITIRTPGTMYVPRTLAKAGLAAYEPFGLDCFLALVDLAPPGAVFDIGANVGVYGLLAAAYSDRDVHLFEPTPAAAAIIVAADLPEGAHTTVVQAALGEETGTARLYLSDKTDSSNSLNPRFRPHSSHLDVPVERLDDYIARTGVIPSVVKIDTETTEPQVLAGASDLLTRHRPSLMIEVLAGRTEERLEEGLRPFGYTWYHLNGPGRLVPAERVVGDATYQHLMYLALPDEAPDHLWDRMAAWRETLSASTVENRLEKAATPER